MNYQCHNPACELKGELISEKLARRRNQACEACGAPLLPAVGSASESAPVTAAWTANVIATYPILIAQPLAALATKRDVEAQAKTLVDVFTNALKYLALVVETEYLYSPYQSETVNRILDDDLERPLVSAWNKFLREALAFLAQAGHKPFIPELKPFYDSVEGKPRIRISGGGYYDGDGKFVPPAKAEKHGLISAIISYRNNFAHGLNQPEADARKDFEFYYDLLRQMLEGMAWCVRYPLLKREDGRWIRLMGEHPVEAEPAPQDVSPEVLLVLGSPAPGRYLSLVPFLIVPRQFIADVAAGEDVLMYDQTTRKRILYVSPRGHQRETKGTLEHWRKLIEDKRIRLPILTPDALTADEMASRFDRATREITQRKENVLAGAYLSRPAPELELRVWPGTCYPLAALGARAGAGKTCLLEHMVETWSANGHEVMLVSCGRIEHPDILSLLRERLALAETVDLRTLSGVLWNSGRRWVVVLDGLNEHPCRESFLASVLEAARELGSAGLRIVFSFRTEAMEWLKVSESDSRLFVVPPSADKAGPAAPKDEAGVPHIPVGPLDMVERAAMWRLYAKNDPDKYKPAFSFNDMVSESRELAGFLSNPLLLRLFLQIYHNRSIPGRLSRSAFMAEYLKSIFNESGDKGRFLLELGRVFWERKTVRMTVDELFDVPTLANTVRSADVNSAYRKLTSGRLGVIVEWREGDDRHVMFGAEAVLEALLGTVLSQTNPGPEQLVVMLDSHSDYSPARRAITVALRQAVERGGVAVLAQFVQHPGTGVVAVGGEVLADLLLGGHEPAAMARELLAVFPSDSPKALWLTALWADRKLTDEMQYRMAATLVDTIRGDSSRGPRSFFHLLNRKGNLLLGIRLLFALGRNLTHLGDYRNAAKCFIQAGECRFGLPDRDSPDVATTLDNMGCAFDNLPSNLQTWAVGPWVLEMKMEALDLRRKALGEEHLTVADSLSSVGRTYGNLGDHTKALEHQLRALELRRKALGDEHPKVAASLHNIGCAYEEIGEHEKGFEYLFRAVEMRRKVLGEEHPKVANSLSRVGGMYSKLGDHMKALEYQSRALELRRKAFGDEHPDVATSLDLVGMACGDLGNHKKALEYQLRVLELTRKRLGDEHRDMEMRLIIVGITYGKLGQHEEALKHKQEALELRKRLLGGDHPDVAKSLASVGKTDAALGDAAQAEEHKKLAQEMTERLNQRAMDVQKLSAQ